MDSAWWKNIHGALSIFILIAISFYGQLLSLFVCVCSMFYFGVIGKLFCICYAIYWYKDCSCRRGQGSELVRSAAWLKHYCNYFPITTVKTADLTATRNYFLISHPHGLCAFGIIGIGMSSHSNFQKLFPGIRTKLCTLNLHFCIPLFRELMFAFGNISASKKSIVNMLLQSNSKHAISNNDGLTSNAVLLVPGGARETIEARRGVNLVILKNRKGFVKIAIETGVPLVPCYSFGEDDVIDQVNNEPGTKIRKFQEFVKKWTGIPLYIASGIGITENSSGILPHHLPITIVIGAPIEVKRNETPSQKEVDAMHALYVEALTKLFNDHKHKYIKNSENVELIIQ